MISKATICGLVLGFGMAPEVLAKPKAAVMPLVPKRTPAETAQVLDDILVAAIDRLDRYVVVGASDIRAVLGFERMKDAIGCDDVACAAEIGGALGVEYLITGSIGKLGEEIIVTLTLIDSKKQEPIGRGQAKVPSGREDLYQGAIEKAVAEIFGKVRRTESRAAVVEKPWMKHGVSRSVWIAYQHYSRAARNASFTPVELPIYVERVVKQHGEWIEYFRYRRLALDRGEAPKDFATWAQK